MADDVSQVSIVTVAGVFRPDHIVLFHRVGKFFVSARQNGPDEGNVALINCTQDTHPFQCRYAGPLEKPHQ